MRVAMHSTTKVVALVVGGQEITARIWEGTTAGGVPCHAYVIRIAHAIGANAHEFESELQEVAAPSPAIETIPMRMIL